jgi:hypothetical protein
LDGGEIDDKTTPLITTSTFGPHLATMQFDELLNDRKTEAGGGFASGGSSREALEAAKHPHRQLAIINIAMIW